MEYTIKKLADLAGVSVRTLHFYDQAGLLKPSRTADNGYRYYGREELGRLQSILFFRELRFPLGRIREVLNSPGFDRQDALRDQLAMLKMERQRLDAIIATVTDTLNESHMNDDELYGGLSRDQLDEYAEEARQRWGNTDAYTQSQERVAKLSKDELKAIADRGVEIAKDLAAHMAEGPESPAVQALIDEQYRDTQRFYDCSLEMFRNLAVMTTQDERYAAYYRTWDKDLPEFRLKAVEYYCAQ